MTYLLDTNVVSELMRRSTADQVRKWVDRHYADCALPTPAIFELRAGLAEMPDGRRRDELLGALERIIARFGPRLYALDRAAAEMGGDLSGEARRRGRPMSRMDAQIAGIAGLYGLTLVTRNLRDFESLGIDLVDPWEG